MLITGGSDGKASAGSAGDPGLIPGSRRSPGEGNSNPLQYYCSLAPHERLTDLAVVPREKPHTGAAAREPPLDSPVIER